MSDALQILAVTTSRADFSRLEPVLEALRLIPGLEVELVVAGYHWTGNGVSRDDIAAGHWRQRLLRPPPAATPWALAGDLLTALADSLQRQRPFCLLLLGDRHELLSCAMAALYHRVPVVHIGGGYETRGAMDEAIRHSVSQLATWHLVANEACARRVIAMGAEPDRVRQVGAPDLDLVRRQPRLGRDELLRPLGLEPDQPFLLVTLHPETASPPGQAAVAGTFRALARDRRQLLITGPADEPGVQVIQAQIDRLLAERPGTAFCQTLGKARYVTAMAEAAALVGNTSSGLIEASLLPVPVIDIGDRQAGRPAGKMVYRCPWGEAPLVTALAAVPSQPTVCTTSPYGDGHTAEAIASFFRELLAQNRQPAVAS